MIGKQFHAIWSTLSEGGGREKYESNTSFTKTSVCLIIFVEDCRLEHENQTLLNHFTRWCTWANVIIRVDKCLTFGIKTSSTSSTQYLSKLLINQSQRFAGYIQKMEANIKLEIIQKTALLGTARLLRKVLSL